MLTITPSGHRQPTLYLFQFYVSSYPINITNLTRTNRRVPRVEITRNQFKTTFILRVFIVSEDCQHVSPHAMPCPKSDFPRSKTFCSRNGSIALISGAKFERKHGLFVELLSKEQWSDNSIFGTGRVYSMGDGRWLIQSFDCFSVN